MRNGTYYLNNSGSRYVIYPKQKVLAVHIAGNYRKIRTVEHYEMFGNFSLAVLRYQKKRVSAFLIESDYIKDNFEKLPIFLIDHREKNLLF